MPKDLSTLISQSKWFHAIDFGNGQISPGRFEDRQPANYTLFGSFQWLSELDLTGARAVDVGTMDGLVAFQLKALGAKEVIATDLAPRETFEAGRAHLGLDIDYRVPVSVLELPASLGEAKADVVVMAGVLYHVFDPLNVLVACRESLKREGFLIVETTYLFDEGRPRMSFNPTDDSPRGIERANVFWRPSKRALEGMLQLAGFEVIGSMAVDGRIAMLAQAKRPSEIRARSKRLENIHQRYMQYTNYRERVDFTALESDADDVSRVRYRGPRGDRRIYPALHDPQVPYQPSRQVGDRAWASALPLARHTARSAWFHARSTWAELQAQIAQLLSR